MKFIISFSVFVLISYTSAKEEKCDGIFVHQKIHRKEVLARGLNRPYSLSFYKQNQTIFFSHNVGSQDNDTFQIAFIEKKHPPVALPVKNGFATAVNEIKNEAYLGGSEGIRVIPLTEKPLQKNNNSFNIVMNHDIWYLFHHADDLYFINFPDLKLHKQYYKGNKTVVEKVAKIPEKIGHFIIDGDGDTFITNKTGLYMIKKGENSRTRILGKYKEFRTITLNSTGHVYLAGGSSIYTLNKHKNELEEIAIIEHVFGLTFDKDDHIIYSNPHQIVKLLPDC